MIINIRGTSGSGKTHLIRKIMDGLDLSPVMIEGRRKPYFYRGGGLVFLGHYESACGGMDTLKTADEIDELMREHGRDGIVVCEGLLRSEDFKRTAALAKEGLDIRVLVLDTPLDVCLASINDRRRAKKPDAPPVDPKNTTNRVRAIRSACRRLKAAGVSVETISRDNGETRIKEILDAYVSRSECPAGAPGDQSGVA